jgi:aminomethyltransferase
MMPVQYTNVIDEHIATRTRAGLFDICHMGEIMVTGPDALDFLQHVVTNDISKLTPGKCLYSAICHEYGGTIDDLLVYMFNTERYLVVVNSGTNVRDIKHLYTILENSGKNWDVAISDETYRTAKLDLQGPLAEAILQQSADVDLSSLSRFSFVSTRLYGREAIISRTGYTGEDGFELYFDLYFDPAVCIGIWNSLMEDGKKFGLQPIGLGARDTLRIESGYSLYGHELSPAISPVEAGIGFVVRDKLQDYPGKKVLLEQKTFGTGRILICFQMLDRGIPREHYDIYNERNKKIGYVTSGTYSPTGKNGIGLGLIGFPLSSGENIFISIRGKLSPAVIINRPYYKRGGME